MQVPVIVDENQGGKSVNDSWEIAKYLEKTYPDQPSLFKGTSGTLYTRFDDVCSLLRKQSIYISRRTSVGIKFTQVLEHGIQLKWSLQSCLCM